MRKNSLYNTVKNARELLESNSVNNMVLNELRKSYVDAADLDSFVSAADKIFPSLNCGIASLYLKQALKQGKVVKGSYNGNSHTFLILDKEKIIDITADQHGGPAIYVGPLISPWKIQSK